MLALAARPAAVQAQWRLSAEFGLVGYRGLTAPANPADTIELRPYGPSQYGLGVARAFGAWEVGLSFHATAGAALGKIFDFALVDGSGLDATTAEPVLARRVAGGAARALWVEAGPQFTLWQSPGMDTKVELGAIAGISLRQALSDKFGTNIRANVAFSPSPFSQNFLPPELKPATVWQFGLLIGLDFKP